MPYLFKKVKLKERMKTKKFAELFPERLIQRVERIIESQANGYMKTIGIHTNCKLFQGE